MDGAGKTRELALHGGPRIREEPWPRRGLVGPEEKAAVDALFDDAIRSGDAFGYGGPQEQAYCAEFAAFMGGGFADGVNSGTNAIFVALHSLRLEPFTEVIVGAVTDPGGMMPIPLLNLVPMVADAAPGCYNSGPEQFKVLISPRTSAILAAHIAGEPADMEGICELARRHGLAVIEDCAQAHGATLGGNPVGTFGDVAAFSTMFGKHHCTGGQGGLVYTTRESLLRAIRRSADRGKPFDPEADPGNVLASLNFNMDELSAAIGRVQLKKLPGIVAARREFVADLARRISGLRAVSIPDPLSGASPSYWFLRLRFDPDAVSCDKSTFCNALAAEGLPVQKDYRNALPHTMPWFRNRTVFRDSEYPWASPDYGGDRSPRFECPNAERSMDGHFILHFNESWGSREAADAAAILRKVDEAFRRE